MSLLLWRDYLETGLPRIDAQHRHLVDLVNRLGPTLAGAESLPEADLREMLDEVVDYAGYHFRDEEAAMAQGGLVPEAFAHHRGAHEAFASRIAGLAGAVVRREPGSGDRLLSMLSSWLLLHIVGEDQAMARQLRLRQAGLSAAEAFAQAGGADTRPEPATLSRALVDVYVLLSRQNAEVRASSREIVAQREVIARHNVSLEQAVRDRTRELEALAGDLARARDAAQAADHVKSRILGTVGHELRTPLNAIAGFTHALASGPLTEAQSDAVKEIARAGGRLAELVDRLLTFAGNEAPGTPQPFAPATLVAQAADHGRALAHPRGIEVVVANEADVPAALTGDPAAIAAILRQLVENAVKFTASGTVRLSVSVAARDEADVTLRFAVADTGIGIPEEDLPRLFDAFGQLDGSLSRRYEGLGLGLAISRKMAERLGGRLSVESRPGEGSRFTLEARFAPVEAPAPREASDADPDEWLARWMGLLAMFDVTAIGELARMPAAVRHRFAERLPDIERAVQRYEFDEAVRLLRDEPPPSPAESRVMP